MGLGFWILVALVVFIVLAPLALKLHPFWPCLAAALLARLCLPVPALEYSPKHITHGLVEFLG